MSQQIEATCPYCREKEIIDESKQRDYKCICQQKTDQKPYFNECRNEPGQLHRWWSSVLKADCQKCESLREERRLQRLLDSRYNSKIKVDGIVQKPLADDILTPMPNYQTEIQQKIIENKIKEAEFTKEYQAKTLELLQKILDKLNSDAEIHPLEEK